MTDAFQPDVTQFAHPPVDTLESVGENQNSGPVIRSSPTSSQVPQSRPSVILPKEQQAMKKNELTTMIVLSLIAIAAGIGTGFGGYKLQAKSGGIGPIPSGDLKQVAGDSVKEGDVFGVNDENTFKDSAEGYLEIGGLDGEGSHKLLREGGVSQTVYLTSSITDLDKFDGMQVKVWGETFKGQKAGWLMDVGRVQIVKLKGEAPAEE